VRSRDFRDRLLRRARKAGVAVQDEAILPLEAYFDLLARWNAKINLTALPLTTPTDETFDRLFVEPLAAARHIRDAPIAWFDLGSGGGSPAIPLKVVRPATTLVMVESKARKAAFLREAIRTLGLADASVLNVRAEAIPRDWTARVDVVTLRAVRADANLAAVCAQLLRDGGELLWFRATIAAASVSAFSHVGTTELLAGRAYLARYARVPRGTI